MEKAVEGDPATAFLCVRVSAEKGVLILEHDVGSLVFKRRSVSARSGGKAKPKGVD